MSEQPTGSNSKLTNVVARIRHSVPDLNGVMIASVDGLSVAYDLPEAEAERIAAMAAAALGLGGRITEGASLGGQVEAVFRGDRGYFVVYPAGTSAVLVLSGPDSANLGLMRIEARSAAAEIQKILG